MRFTLTFVLHLLPLVGWPSAVQAQGVDGLISCLKSSLSPQGSVVLPSDAVFESDTLRFSTYHAPGFRVVSRVANEHDVRASILCAQQTDTPFLVTGPRHGFYSHFSDLQNGLEILTVAFSEVAVDAEVNTMTIGGAVTMQQATDALYAVGKNIPIGSGPCVGFVGASLGAGIGRLQGLYGTMSDSLLSARIMLPNTTVVEASTDTNADLFWAIRGAGFNLGVVLNATFQIYDAPEPHGHNFNADFEFSVTIARSFYQALKDKASTMPAPLCISTNLAWSETYNGTTLRVNAIYAGPEREGRQAVQFLQHLGPHLRQNFTSVPWNELAQTAFFTNGSQDVLNCELSLGPRSVRGAAFNVLDVNAHVQMTELFNEMVTRYPQTRLSDNSMYFCASQGVQAVPDNTTAYRWRHALGHQTWGISFASDNGTDASIANLPQQLRETIARTAGTDGLNVYVGFSNGDEPLEAVFSRENLPRLAATKKKYDPESLFNAYHPLPTSYP